MSTGKLLKPFVDNGGYARVSLCVEGKSKPHRIHKLVVDEFLVNPGTHEKFVIDHIDRCRSNNKVSNLRWTPCREHNWNLWKILKPCTSKYKGVSYEKKNKKWRACIYNDNVRTHIGLFHNERDAARAYNKKVRELRDEYAVLNDISDDED